MVDRVKVYPQEELLDTHILKTNKFAMMGLGFLTQAVLGTTTLVDGLACAPTSPASLSVTVATGSIYSLQAVDATAYGTEPADTLNQIVKQGIVLGSTTFAITPPATSGKSQVYLVQAAYQDQDAASTSIPFINSSDGSQTFQTVNTERRGVCVLQLKPGVIANTGSQATPAPDAGYIGLHAITVANGQTTITGANIVTLPSAPYFPKLSALGLLALRNIGAGLYDDGSGNLAARNTRETLTSSRTYYVSPTGSDSNNGLTAGSAFATIQYAVNLIQAKLDLAGQSAIIQVQDGTYGQATTISGPFVGNGNVIIQGNAATPANCIISLSSAGNCFYATERAAVSIQGFTLATSNGWCIYAEKNSLVNIIGGMTYGNASGPAKAHIAAADGAQVTISANYTLSGSSTYHWSAIRGGRIMPSFIAVNATGTPAFTAFANAIDCGVIYPSTITFSGASITGARYSATLNGIIDTSGSGATYLPGNSAGTFATGGQYA